MLLISEAPNLFYSFALQMAALAVAGVIGIAVYRVLGGFAGGSGPKPRK